MKFIIKRAFIVLIFILLAASAWIVYRAGDHPPLGSYAGLTLPEAGGTGVRVTNLGVTTILFDDGETAILTDGFFTRPDLIRMLLKPLQSDKAIVAASLARAGVKHLAAVVVVHTHYDHVMDAPEVARQTGAMVVGSESTANVARGSGIPEKQIRVVQSGEPMQFGKFKVTLIRSKHVSKGKPSGEIREPVKLPMRASDYLEGGSYSVLIEHGDKSMLVQGSAGFVDGALRGRHADTVFLGTGMLGSMDDAYRKAYWKEVVQAVGATRVIPIHWDDFTKPLDQPLVGMPKLLDDFNVSMPFLIKRGKEEAVDIRLAPTWIKVDPFVAR